jgi:adenosylcobinamide-GDP ribazoletransferase
MKCTFPLSLTFLTKVPWPWQGEAAPQDLARSMRWFPWVGALLGLAYVGGWWGLGLLLPGPAAAALLLALTVLSTGALHLDGLADTVDGLGGGHTPADRLRIMKDSRVGAFGVISLVLALLLKFAFFLALASKGPVFWPLFLFPVVSRWGMTFLAFLAPYARPEGGLGQAMTQGLDHRTLAWSTVGALVLAAAVARVQGLLLLLAAGVAVWLASHYFKRMLGGVTGDVLGAINELLEILVLGCSLLLL